MALRAATSLASRSFTAASACTTRVSRSSHIRPSLSRGRVACMATAAGPKYWLLNYTYVPDILEKRGPYREAHLAGAKQHLDAGRLVAAGAVGDPVEGATFFFKDISKVCRSCAC